MKITFEGSYKSLSSFTSDELYGFTVITGKNGSGKTQLIEIIDKYRNRGLHGGTLSFSEEMKDIQIEGVQKSNLSPLRNQQVMSKLTDLIKTYNRYVPAISELLRELDRKNLTWEYLKDTPIESVMEGISTAELSEYMRKALQAISSNTLITFSNRKLQDIAPDEYKKLLFNTIAPDYLNKVIILAKEVAEHFNEDYTRLDAGHFFNAPLSSEYFDEQNIFVSNVAYLFYAYAKGRYNNDLNFYRKKQHGHNNNAVKDEEYINLNPPPWAEMNNIFDEIGLCFKFEGVELFNFNPDADLEFKLVNTNLDKDVNFNDLSSGEKVILGMVVQLFTCNWYGDKVMLPSLLVLDEPDAHLHPEMSKILIDVLYKTFVQKLGMKVIMTTHSPSTIALCPEEAIYQLSNYPVCSLTKVSKDKALELLTGFIPTLSIDYNNHKQVFVESPTDRLYYQKVFDRLNQEKRYTSKLYFIANGYGKGNCDQVKQIVSDIRKSGNQTSFGVVDWDNKNTSNDLVKVHGEGIRYSIESYTYDPIYLAILLMDMEAHNIHAELDLDTSFNHYSISEDIELVNKIIAWFFEKVYEKFPALKKDTSTTVKYHNGMEVSMPTWYIQYQGHDLEMKLKQVFPALSKYRDEGEFQKKVTTLLVRSYPFIPQDTVDLMESIMG